MILKSQKLDFVQLNWFNLYQQAVLNGSDMCVKILAMLLANSSIGISATWSMLISGASLEMMQTGITVDGVGTWLIMLVGQVLTHDLWFTTSLVGGSTIPPSECLALVMLHPGLSLFSTSSMDALRLKALSVASLSFIDTVIGTSPQGGLCLVPHSYHLLFYLKKLGWWLFVRPSVHALHCSIWCGCVNSLKVHGMVVC